MSRNTAQFKFIHIEVNLTVSESDNSWYDPKASQHFNLSIPVCMFDNKKFTELVEAQIKVLGPAFDAEKARVEAEEKAKADAEASGNSN